MPLGSPLLGYPDASFACQFCFQRVTGVQRIAWDENWRGSVCGVVWVVGAEWEGLSSMSFTGLVGGSSIDRVHLKIGKYHKYTVIWNKYPDWLEHFLYIIYFCLFISVLID